MKRFFFAAAILLGCCTLRSAEAVRQDGVYLLKNSCLTVEIDPAAGGRVTRLLDRKSGAELTRYFPVSQAPAGSGFFADRLWPVKGGQSRHYERTAFKVISCKADKTGAELKLRCDSKPLDIEKTYILRENERTLRVRYALSNPGDKPFTGRFWTGGVITPGGESWQVMLPEGNYSDKYPNKGPVKLVTPRYDPKAPVSGNHWSFSPRQDYGCVFSGKAGAALVAPFEFLDIFYSCFPGAGAMNRPTLEWMSTLLHIKPLAAGKADAVNHPELEDPLQDYIVRFETVLTVFDKADVKNFRPAPKTAKSTRFQPVLNAEKPHQDFVLPAVPWFARQKENPRVLFFSPAVVAPEAFDFLRRFRCDAEVVEGWRMTGKAGIIYHGYNIPDPEAMAEKALRASPQVIFIPGFTSATMGKKLNALLMEKVKQGAVVIYVSDSNRFPALFPRKGGKEVPAELFRGIPFKVKIMEHRVGRGRVFFVPFRLHLNGRFYAQPCLLLPAPEVDSPAPEHVYALYCRLLRYALNYTSGAQILKAEVKGSQAEVTVSAKKSFKGTLNGKAVTFKAGENKIVLPFEREKLNGTYDLPLLLELDGHSADIFIARYEVKQLPRIVKFAPEKYAHESEEEIRVSLGLEGRGNVTISLEDAEGRVLAREVKKDFSGEGRFALKPAFFGVNSFCRLTAEVRGKNGVTERRTCTVSRRTPDDSRLRFVLWHNSNVTPTEMLRHQGVREMGFTHLLGGQTPALSALDSRLGAEAIQQTGGRYMVNTIYRFVQSIASIAKESRLRNPCLHDPKGLEQIRKDVRERAAKHAPNFPVIYYSADENSLGWHDTPHDFCFTPSSLKKFREAMKKKYGTLEKLNTAWRSAFKNWDEVMPFTLAEARKKGNFTPWLAHRIFMFSALDSGVAAVRDELLKVDPKAKLGHSGQGLTRINDCWDWRVMLRHYSQSSLYGRPGGLPDIVRTRDPRYPAGNWNGYGMPPDQVRFHCWNAVTDGLFAPAYWYDNYFFRRGDNRLNETGLHMKGLIAEVKSSGADPLMTRGKRVLSPFTLVYSPDSLAAAVVTGERSVLNRAAYTDNFIGWSLLLRSAGFPAPQAVGDDKIAGVTPENTPVLVLPMLQLMSDEQIAHVKKYAEAGGILVIDAQAGLFDGFYTRRKENPLLALAGVKVPEAEGTGGGTLFFGNTPVKLIPTGAQAVSAGARALGSVAVKTPASRFHSIELGELSRTMCGAFFMRKTGRGYVIYLNGLLNGVGTSLADPAALAPTLKAFRELFAAAGIRPVATAACGANHSVYVYGRYTALAATRREGAGTERFVYPLDGKYFLYDTLAHKFMGQRDSVELFLKGNDARMVVALREKPAPPRLTARRLARGIAVDSASDSGIWHGAIFHEGKELTPLARCAVLDRGGKLFFELGLAPAGRYTVKMKNILTGETFNYEARY